MHTRPDRGENEHPILTDSSHFQFDCNEDIPCFTQCCRDVNIYLMPYDVLRLRRALKMSSGDVLRRYTRHFLAKSVPIPVVQLAMDPDTLYCKLVTETGCSVYGDRPWACRMYPLDLGGRSGEYCRISGSERCMGFSQNRSWTVREWLEGQGLPRYVEMEKEYQAIVPPDMLSGESVDPAFGRMMFLAYDLDHFASLLENKGFRKIYEVDDDTFSRIQEDDEELLMLAFRYIRCQLDEFLGFS